MKECHEGMRLCRRIVDLERHSRESLPGGAKVDSLSEVHIANNWLSTVLSKLKTYSKYGR
jgi:hypothetical protein